MTTQEIVSKLWNLCNVLRDDGITFHQYVTELTYILFLKMAKATGTETQIPAGYRWDILKSKSGIELKKFYKELLNHLGENCTGRVREIYQGAATNIDEPKNLEKIITNIDVLDLTSKHFGVIDQLFKRHHRKSWDGKLGNDKNRRHCPEFRIHRYIIDEKVGKRHQIAPPRKQNRQYSSSQQCPLHRAFDNE